MAINAVNVTSTPGFNINAQQAITGLPASQGAKVAQNIQQPTLALGTNAANAAAGGANEVILLSFTIAASGNHTIDLTSVVDALGQTAISLARVKLANFFLLSASQTLADGTTVGTACSGVSVGNAGGDGTNGQPLDLDLQTETFTLGNGGSHCVNNGNATGWVVDGTHKLLYFVNNDGAVTAQLYVELVGGTT